VTIGPVNDIVRLMNDRHVQARALLADYPDEDMGSFPMHAVPARLSETPGTIRTPAPRLDSHRDILAEAGLTDERSTQPWLRGLRRRRRT